jgi:hypothetical protein
MLTRFELSKRDLDRHPGEHLPGLGLATPATRQKRAHERAAPSIPGRHGTPTLESVAALLLQPNRTYDPSAAVIILS